MEDYNIQSCQWMECDHFRQPFVLCTTFCSFLCTVQYFICAYFISAKMATYSLGGGGLENEQGGRGGGRGQNSGILSEHTLWMSPYWTHPQGCCILMNVFEFFKFSAPGSISQYGNTLWALWAMNLYHIQFSRQSKAQFQQLETSFLEIDTNNLADKCKIYFCSH